MTWNYRVTKEVVNGETQYAIREVYYGLDDAGGLGWTANPAEPAEESLEDLKATLQRMLEACDKPVIDITDEDNPKEET